MNPAHFVKMESLGNDYIYFNGLACSIPKEMLEQAGTAAPVLCDRRFGVGGDGLVFILPDDEADALVRMFNADGSEGEVCGSALKCVAALLSCEDESKSASALTLRMGGRIYQAEIIDAFPEILVRVDMGAPEFDGESAPNELGEPPFLDREIAGPEGEPIRFTYVGMGNPHVVVFQDEPDADAFRRIGPFLENHPVFPNRTNVEFVRVADESTLDVLVWERGSGETTACGSGACAAAVASVLLEKTERNVKICFQGGILDIEWLHAGNVLQTGPAREVYRGMIDLNKRLRRESRGR